MRRRVPAQPHEPEREKYAATEEKQDEGDAAGDADGIKPRQQVAALDRASPDLAIGQQRIDGVQHARIARIAGERARIRDGSARLPSLSAQVWAPSSLRYMPRCVVTTIAVAFSSAAMPRTFVCGSGSRPSEGAPSEPEIIAAIKSIRGGRPGAGGRIGIETDHHPPAPGAERRLGAANDGRHHRCAASSPSTTARSTSRGLVATASAVISACSARSVGAKS